MLNIKNKIEFENNCWVGEVNASQFNSSQEERIKTVTDIASVTKGRLGFNENSKGAMFTEYNTIFARESLYERLLIESADNPSTPFEFIPVVVCAKFNSLKSIEVCGYDLIATQFFNEVTKYGYIDIDNPDSGYDIIKIYTNMRTLLKAGIKEEDIPFNTPEELKGFKVIVGKFPKVAFDHIIRHRQLSPNAESSRNKKYLKEVEFHYPEYWQQREQQLLRVSFTEIMQNNDNDTIEFFKEHIYHSFIKPEDATKELSCRRLMLSVWAGWKQDLNTWNNLFKVRESSNTQSITKQVVDNIKSIIY